MARSGCGRATVGGAGSCAYETAELTRVRGLGAAKAVRVKAGRDLRQRLATRHTDDLAGDIARVVRGQEDEERR